MEDVDFAFQERLERVVLLFEEHASDFIEVVEVLLVLPAVPPPVMPPFENEIEAFLQLLDAIRAGHDGKLEVDLVEILSLPNVLRKDLHAAACAEILPVDFLRTEANGFSIIHDFRNFQTFKSQFVRSGHVLRIHDGLVGLVVHVRRPGGEQ